MDELTKTEILDSWITYREAGHAAGAGLTVVFLHGNPTSSRLWRNAIPEVAGQARSLSRERPTSGS